MDRILENILLANIKGSYMILKNKKNLAYLEIFFVPLSLKTMRNSRSSPQKSKKFYPKILLFMHN
jgi:hypothetical protein